MGDPQAAIRREFLAELDRQIDFARNLMPHLSDAETRHWWWEDEDGNIVVRLRFRGVVVRVNGEADTALLYDPADIMKVLVAAREAAVCGGLDAQLSEAAKRANNS